MSCAFLYKDGAARRCDPLEAVTQAADQAMVWIHIDGSDTGLRDRLFDRAHLSADARRALVARETRPRSEKLNGGAIVNLRGLATVEPDSGDPLVAVRMWVEKGRCISLSYRAPGSLDAMIRHFLAGEIKDPGDLITGFAMEITDALDPDVANLGDRLDDVECAIDEGQVFHMRRNIAEIRSRAISYRRFIAPQRQALEKLSTSDLHWLDEVDLRHLRDAADRCARMAEELEAIRERAAIAHEELTDLRAEQTDTRALQISIIAVVFLPLTFLTGLLGMNVEGIPYAHEPWAFAGVVGVCIAMAAGITAWFVKAHWLRR